MEVVHGDQVHFLKVGDNIRLLIDMDECICNFLERLCLEYNYLYNKNLRPEEITSWDLASYIGVHGKEIFKKPGFFINLKPFDNAINILFRLHYEKHDILIVTNPPNGVTAAEKYAWCKEYLSFIPQENIIMCARKDLIDGDLILDDCPKYLEEFKGISVCMDKLYNQNARCDYRVSNWIEFYNLVKSLEQGLTKEI